MAVPITVSTLTLDGSIQRLTLGNGDHMIQARDGSAFQVSHDSEGSPYFTFFARTGWEFKFMNEIAQDIYVQGTAGSILEILVLKELG